MEMKILAMDSSGAVASVAVLNDDILVGEISLNNSLTHSQSLLPMIDQVLHMTGTEGTDLDCLAIAAGPGSFTGLRIGASTVKGLAMVWNKPIAAVPTVDALACNCFGTSRLVCPILDARRGQVYGGLYEFVDGELRVLIPQVCTELTNLVKEINAYGRPVIILGDGVEANKRKLPELMEAPYVLAPAHLSKQRAGSVGILAMKYAEEGKLVDVARFVPEYLRKSQAEREKEEQGK